MKEIFRTILTLLTVVFVLSCGTMQNEKVSSKITHTETFKVTTELKIAETTVIKNPVFYGNNCEVQAYKDNNSKVLYIIGSLNALNMTDKDIAVNTIDLSRIKVKEEILHGKKGIVLTFYDILIFLEEKSGDLPAAVAIFEPQKSAWVFGEDIDNSNKSILIKIDSSRLAGPIKIGTRNISRAYN